MKVLLTGADGFVGPWVRRELEDAGHEVVPANGPGAAHAALDLRSASEVSAVVKGARPDGIINLAGQSSVAVSHAHPADAFATNTLGVVQLLTAVRDHSPRTRVLLVSSGEVYGPLPEGQRATEETPLHPVSPYAASKVAAEVAGQQFASSYGLQVVLVRPFNHLGRGQAPSFMVPSFARQLASVRQGEQAPRLLVGNLEPVRDFSHVADVAAGYRLLLERGATGEAYNLCSGEGISVRAVLELLVRLAGVEVAVEIDPARFRPSDAPRMVGDPAKVTRLGWRPRFSLQEALLDVLADASTPRPPAAPTHG